MKFVMFSMFDMTSRVYLQPFVARSEHDAKRNLAAAFEDPAFKQTPAGKYPDEFALMDIGTFDDETGILEVSTPRKVCTLGDVSPING